MTNKKLTFKSYYKVEVIDAKTILIFDEVDNAFIFKGSIYVRIIPYLYHNQSYMDDIADDLQSDYPFSQIYYVLLTLEKKGLLTEHTNIQPQEIERFTHIIGTSPVEASDLAKDTTFSIVNYSTSDEKAFRSALEELSLTVCDNGDLILVLVDDYRDKRLHVFNLEATKMNKKWLLIKPNGIEPCIGPLFTPPKKGCYHCLYERLKLNFIAQEFAERLKTRNTISKSYTLELKQIQNLTFNLAALELYKWVTKSPYNMLGENVLSYNTLKPELKTHIFVPVEHCPYCYKKKGVDNLAPLHLESQKKYFTEDGGHRAVTPEETVKKYQHHISHITGVIQNFRCTTSSPLTYITQGVHTIRNFNTDHEIRQIRIGSAGKGKTEVQSKASCIGEALERFSAVYRGNEITRKGRYIDLLKEGVIHPKEVLHFSDYQYKNRLELNKILTEFHKIPNPFNEEEVTDWTPAWSIKDQKHKWVPTALCYFDYPFENQSVFCFGCSNGNASGNTLEEAVLQGAFEVIERDAIAIWWYSRFQRPEVDIYSFPDPYISRFVKYYESIGRKVWAIDLTFDLGIPTIGAVSCIEETGEKILIGFGSHFDPKIALLRALTELNQSLEMTSSKYDIANFLAEFNAWYKWTTQERVEDHPYLLPKKDEAPKRFQDYHRFDSNDLKEDILICEKKVREIGLEMLILDQTRSDIGLNAAKVIIPGLRHFWNRFAPGRLYDIPVELGLIPKRLKEEDLNPIPIFF